MYPKSIRADILAEIASGRSLRSVCRDEGMPSIRQAMAWLDADEDFAQQYARAMLVRADVKFDELDEVSQKAEDCESAVKVAGLPGSLEAIVTVPSNTRFLIWTFE